MVASRRYIQRLRVFLGLERNMVVMTAAGLLQGFGAALWLGFFSMFLKELGASGTMIGAFGTIGAFLGIAFVFLGGLLSDRLGRTQAMVVAGLLAAAGYLAYMLAPVWWLLLPGLVLTTAAANFGFMGALALTGDALRSTHRATGMAVRGLIGMVPGIIAPALGGLIIMREGIVRGVRLSLLLTALLTLAGVWLQRRYYRLRRPAADPDKVTWSWRQLAVPPGLRKLLVADCLLRFGWGMSVMFVVLYVIDVLGSSEARFGFLMSLATLVSALLALPVAKFAERGRGGARRWVVAATFFFFTVYPFAVAAIPSAAWLVPVFVLCGLCHAGEPTRKSLLINLAEGPNRGRLMGAYHSIRSAAVLPSAFIGGWLWDWAPAAPFFIGSGISALGLLWFLIAGAGTGPQKASGEASA